MKSNTWCVNPYLNLSVHPSGVIKPCCMSYKEYKTDSEIKTVDKASILEFWNSTDKKKFIEDLNKGIKVTECSACWKEEAAGKESKRIRDNAIYEHLSLDENTLPVVVDLSMGNLCNLKCRICSPTHSSPWMIEEAELQHPGKKQIFLKQERWQISKNSFTEENNFFWNDIIKLLPNVEKFDFAGGEPFYIEKHWDLVKTCVENGWSKNQHIHYNTNGTIFPKKYIDLLNQFKIVDIQISSDGVDRKFEYMRHPAVWNDVEENVNKFILERKPNWLLSICISISAFNVYDFFETYEHYASKGIGIYINVVHDGNGVRVLPVELKNTIIQRLKSFESKYANDQWIRERDMICNHLENTEYNDYDWKIFCNEMQTRDKIRNESFKDTFPEYYGYMKKYVE